MDKDETYTNTGDTLLTTSAFFNYLLPFQKMLIAVGCDVNKARNDGATPLYIASQEGHKKVVEILIRSDADVNKASHSGATPLYIASQEGHIKVVEILIRSDADVNKARNDGATPLFIASHEGHIDTFELLIRSDADVMRGDEEGSETRDTKEEDNESEDIKYEEEEWSESQEEERAEESAESEEEIVESEEERRATEAKEVEKNREWLNVWQWNANSLGGGEGYKSSTREMYIIHKVENCSPDIMFISETLKGPRDQRRPAGYIAFDRPGIKRKKGRSGGVVMWVRDGAEVQRRQDIEGKFEESSGKAYIQAIAVELKDWKDRSLIVVGLYNNNGGKRSHMEKIVRAIRETVAENKYVVVIGDLNARALAAGNVRTNAAGDVLDAYLEMGEVVMCNDGSPTHAARRDGRSVESILDYTLCSRELMGSFGQWRIVESGESDHSLIATVFKTKAHTSRTKRTEVEVIDEKRLLKEIAASTELWKSPTSKDETESACAWLTRVIEEAKEKATDRRSRKCRTIPGWTKEMENIRRKKKRAYREERWAVYKRLRRKLEKLVKAKKREAWRKATGEITAKTTSREFWKKAKRFMRAGKSVPLRVSANVKIAKSTANAINDQLCRVANDQNIGVGFNIAVLEDEIGQLRGLWGRIEEWEVYRAMEIPSVYSAAGQDGISVKTIRDVWQFIKGILLELTNAILEYEADIKEWKHALVHPLPKAGRSKVPGVPNTRPIALLSQVGKIFDRVMLLRSKTWAADENIIPIEQFGCREDSGAQDAIVRFKAIVTGKKRAERKKRKSDRRARRKNNANERTRNRGVGAVLLDCSKAYDRVHGPLLVDILLEHKCPVYLAKWVWRMVRGRTAATRVNGTLSDEKELVNGVWQGNPSSPTLWCIYFADLSKKLASISGITVQVFVDDVAVMAEGEFETVKDKLQRAVDMAKDWGEKYYVDFNPSKTNAMWFGERRVVTEAREDVLAEIVKQKREEDAKLGRKWLFPKMQISQIKQRNRRMLEQFDEKKLKWGETNIEWRKEAMYLGVLWDDKLSMAAQIQRTRHMANGRFNDLKSLRGKKWGVSPGIMRHLVQGYLGGALEYALPVVGDRNISTLETVLSKGMRLIRGGYSSTPREALYSETNMRPLRERWTELENRRVAKWLTAKGRCVCREDMEAGRGEWKDYKRRAVQLKVEWAGSLTENGYITPEMITELQGVGIVCGRPKIREGADKREVRVAWEEYLLEVTGGVVVYTDGSLDQEKGEAGCGYSVRMLSKDVAASTGLRGAGSSTQTEKEAVTRALKVIANWKEAQTDGITVVSDNMSLIRELDEVMDGKVGHVDKSTEEMVKAVRSAWRKCEFVQFVWVKGHCGVRGNELADRAAKTGARSCEKELNMADRSEIMGRIRADAREERRSRLLEYHGAYTLNTGGEFIRTGDESRMAAACRTRVLTGHANVRGHRSRYEENVSPICRFEHILCDCRAGTVRKRRRTLKRRLKTETLNSVREWVGAMRGDDAAKQFHECAVFFRKLDVDI